MCEIGAVCPNCGQQDLDSDERSCITLDGAAYREYRCRCCRALVNVEVPVLPPPGPRIRSVWGQWITGGRVTVALPGDGVG
jgi:hypothetical protein